MQVTYVGPSADLEVNGSVVEAGDVIDVPDDLGAELVARGDFEAAKRAGAKKSDDPDTGGKS